MAKLCERISDCFPPLAIPPEVLITADLCDTINEKLIQIRCVCGGVLSSEML